MSLMSPSGCLGLAAASSHRVGCETAAADKTSLWSSGDQVAVIGFLQQPADEMPPEVFDLSGFRGGGGAVPGSDRTLVNHNTNNVCHTTTRGRSLESAKIS